MDRNLSGHSSCWWQHRLFSILPCIRKTFLLAAVSSGSSIQRTARESRCGPFWRIYGCISLSSAFAATRTGSTTSETDQCWALGKRCSSGLAYAWRRATGAGRPTGCCFSGWASCSCRQYWPGISPLLQTPCACSARPPPSIWSLVSACGRRTTFWRRGCLALPSHAGRFFRESGFWLALALAAAVTIWILVQGVATHRTYFQEWATTPKFHKDYYGRVGRRGRHPGTHNPMPRAWSTCSLTDSSGIMASNTSTRARHRPLSFRIGTTELAA